MAQFKKLLKALHYLPDEDIDDIYQAYLVAEKAHEGQKRASGEPYITHPLSVALILAEIHMDKQTIMAALLHDVIEDTGILKEKLAEQFGQVVSDLVDGVSKLTQIEFKSRVEAQAENFRKMVLAMAKDVRVIIIKLSDRLHNMRTIGVLPPPKRRRIALETLEIYAPIANRLGMHSYYLELEELGFQALYPHRYRVLQAAVKKAIGNRKEIMNVIFKSLKNGLSKERLDNLEILGREKHLYSIYKKMSRQHVQFSEIMDVYGFRIIVNSIPDCYRVLGLVHSFYKPVFERFKDFIALPKANGYQSLHTTLIGPYGVPIEVQIRTHDMDQMANNGIAAHWLYKSGDKLHDMAQLQQQQWLKSLVDMQQRTGNSIEFIENVKVDLFPDEVYVFTPNGTIIRLPRGATPIDFAYAIHTEIGNTCIAAKIDRHSVPLSTPLLNGQTVEIVTSKSSRPNQAWLDFVTTTKAKNNLKHYMKIQQRSESISLGKRLLNKALSSLSLTVKKIPEQKFEHFLGEANLKNVDDLYADIGLGIRTPMLVAHQLANAVKPVVGVLNENQSTSPLFIKGTEGMVVNFARCCCPLPGDPISAVLKPGEGILVHTESCEVLAKQHYTEDELLPVRWSKSSVGEFPVDVSVDVVNKRGVLAGLTLAVADADANIEDIKVYERDVQHFTILFSLLVRSRVHLSEVIRNLRKVKSVVHVKRTVCS